jgi:hypothetical protein
VVSIGHRGDRVGFVVPQQLDRVVLPKEAVFRLPRVLERCSAPWFAGFALVEGRVLSVIDLFRLADEVATQVKEPTL